MKGTDKVTEALQCLSLEAIAPYQTDLGFKFDRDPPWIRPNHITDLEEHADFLSELENDDLLCKLFPDDDESKGRIRTFRPKTIASRLINSALWHLTHRDALSQESILEFLRAEINDLRLLAKGEEVNTPVWAAFGVQLPPDTRLHTSLGVLRNRSNSDKYLVGEEFNPNLGCILDSTFKERQDISSSARVQTSYSPGFNYEKITQLSIALLLVQEGQEIKPAMPWLFCKSQLLGGGLVSSTTQQFKKGLSSEIATS